MAIEAKCCGLVSIVLAKQQKRVCPSSGAWLSTSYTGMLFMAVSAVSLGISEGGKGSSAYSIAGIAVGGIGVWAGMDKADTSHEKDSQPSDKNNIRIRQ